MKAGWPFVEHSRIRREIRAAPIFTLSSTGQDVLVDVLVNEEESKEESKEEGGREREEEAQKEEEIYSHSKTL